MTYSIATYTGTGAPQVLPIPFDYISKSHIHVTVNGVETASFTWLSASSIQVTAPIGAVVVISRSSSMGTRLTNFLDGLSLTSDAINVDSRQGFFLAQENSDSTGSSVTEATVATLAAGITSSSIVALQSSLAASAGSASIGYAQGYSGAVVRTVADRLKDRMSVKDFGAKGDGLTDDTGAIQATVDASIAAGNRAVHIPHGTYVTTAQILITSPVVIYGEGNAATIIRQTTATAGGFNFNYPFYRTGGGLVGLMIEAGAGYETSGHAFTGSGSSGVGVRVQFANDNFVVEDVSIHNFDTASAVISCFNTRWYRCRALFYRTNGLLIDQTTYLGTPYIGGDNRFVHFKLSNNGYSGDNSVSNSVNIRSSGGEHFISVDVTKSNIGFLVAPPAGQQVTYLWFDSCLADTCVGDSWQFDGTTSIIWSVQCVNCWGAYSTNGNGLATKGTNLIAMRWVGGRLRENGASGWSHQGGTHCQISDAEIAANSTTGAGLYAGVDIAAGVNSWAVLGSSIGNFASGFTTQGDGIRIAAGSSQGFRIVGNDLTYCGAGKVPLNNGAAGQNYVIANNLPIQSSGVNETRGALQAGVTLGTVAAGVTTYLGPNAQQPALADSISVAGRPCVIRQVVVQTDNAPGAGQTYTYTVMVNNVATGATGTISGASAFQVSISVPQTLGATDTYTIRLVTSATATPTRHRWVAMLDA